MEDQIKSPNEKLQALYREYADIKEQSLASYSSRQKHQLFSDKKFEKKLIDDDESMI